MVGLHNQLGCSTSSLSRFPRHFTLDTPGRTWYARSRVVAEWPVRREVVPHAVDRLSDCVLCVRGRGDWARGRSVALIPHQQPDLDFDVGSVYGTMRHGMCERGVSLV